MNRSTRQSKSTQKETRSTRTSINNQSTNEYHRPIRSTRKRKARKWFDETDYEDTNRHDRLKKTKCVYFESNDYNEDDCEQENLNEDTQIIDQSLENLNEDSLTQDSNYSDSTIIQDQSSDDSFFDYLAAHDADLPQLNLPISSTDLLLSQSNVDSYLMQICSIYEILNNFKYELRLSPFRLEEFIAAIQLDESNSLFNEIHIVLLKSLIKDDKLNHMHICSGEYKDSISIHFYSIDSLTWPQILKIYIQARANGPVLTYNVDYVRDNDAKTINELFKVEAYSSLSDLKVKLTVLQYLCNLFLETNVVRDKIQNIEQPLAHDYHCRECCNLGDILCCDNCTSAWHLACLKPPLTKVPEGDWFCPNCKLMNIDKTEVFEVRKNHLGRDRHGRKYWWICERIIVSPNELESNEDKKVYYYSTRLQFDELLKQLDGDHHEKKLVQRLQELKDNICNGFDLIYQLNKHALNNKFTNQNAVSSYIDVNIGEYYTENNVEQPGSTVTKVVTRNSVIGKLNDSKHLDDSIYIWKESVDENNGPSVLKRVCKKSLFSTELLNFSFKLGMEAKDYVNLFNANRLFLNKKQNQEERDYKRQLNQRFSASHDFKWHGQVVGPTHILMTTIRKSIQNLEANIHQAFFCPSWAINRNDWLNAVKESNTIQELILSLCILEASIKPIVFHSVWNESLGHYILERTNNLDREERKRIEKLDNKEQIERTDILMRSNPVKNKLIPDQFKNINGPYQLWKLKGEEYRVTGVNGWYWLSSNRVSHKPKSKVKILSIDELSDDERTKVKNTSTINVMREIRSTSDRRIYYPKHFDKKSCPKLEFIEGLLEKRMKLKEALELERANYNGTKKQPELVCYSSDCRNNVNEVRLECLSSDCRVRSSKLKEEEEKEIEDETSKPFYCVKPVYLLNVNENKEIERNINSKRPASIGQLPPFNRFVTKRNKRSIFVLTDPELRRLCRSSGHREIQGSRIGDFDSTLLNQFFNFPLGFIYSSNKSVSNPYVWPFNSTPRPTIRTCWLYKNSTLNEQTGIENLALSLRLLWHCLKWDQMLVKPASSPRTVAHENHRITTELIKRRDLAPYGLHSEYLLRKIVIPLDIDDILPYKPKVLSPTENESTITTPKREGLRKRKQRAIVDESDPKFETTLTEVWVQENKLELCEIKGFNERAKKLALTRQEAKSNKLEPSPSKKVVQSQPSPAKKVVRSKSPSAKKVVQPIKQRSPANNAVDQFKGGFALIRTPEGQTFKTPFHALQGKKPGESISIKFQNPATGELNNESQALILSVFADSQDSPASKTIAQKKSVQASKTSFNQPSKNRPAILNKSVKHKLSQANLATGIRSSSIKNKVELTQSTGNANTVKKIIFLNKAGQPLLNNKTILLNGNQIKNVEVLNLMPVSSVPANLIQQLQDQSNDANSQQSNVKPVKIRQVNLPQQNYTQLLTKPLSNQTLVNQHPIEVVQNVEMLNNVDTSSLLNNQQVEGAEFKSDVQMSNTEIPVDMQVHKQVIETDAVVDSQPVESAHLDQTINQTMDIIIDQNVDQNVNIQPASYDGESFDESSICDPFFSEVSVGAYCEV